MIYSSFFYVKLRGHNLEKVPMHLLVFISQIDLTGEVLKGSSVRKVLVREAKSRAAMAVIVGICKPHSMG